MNKDAITKEEIEAVLAGCDGVTPGPWSHYRNHLRPGSAGFINEVQTGQRRQAIVQWGGFDNSFRPEKKHAKNAAHIARLSPEFVRELAALALEALSSREAGWQPIETFPRDHFPGLVYGPYGQLVAFLDVTWAWWPCPATEALSYIPTHWMPLPTPPDQGSK